MNFLIIADSVPFPAHNGKELPASKLFEKLCVLHKVDLLVLSLNKKADEEKRKNIPPCITLTGIISLKKKKVRTRVLQQLRFLKSNRTFIYDDDAIRKTLTGKHYDWLWIYPITYMEFIEHCHKLEVDFYSRIAIGLNDSLTYLYRDSMNELIGSRQFKTRYILDWLKSFFVAQQEKKYVEQAALVHVQTTIEKNKLKKIIGPASKTKIIVAPNGIKEELLRCNYNGRDAEQILFMTHLDGGRIDESEWFIKKVWGKIMQQIPGAKLLIVGKPPKKQLSYITKFDSIIINGYADDLVQLFNSIRIAVVPTFHGTGLINRILDALTAGVPVVSTPQAIATFPQIKSGTQILSAQDPDVFAQHVIKLYTDKAYRLYIANNGREYANTLPRWEQFTNNIEQAFYSI